MSASHPLLYTTLGLYTNMTMVGYIYILKTGAVFNQFVATSGTQHKLSWTDGPGHFRWALAPDPHLIFHILVPNLDISFNDTLPWG